MKKVYISVLYYHVHNNLIPHVKFKHFQMPKMLSATSKKPTETAPTSPSPGTLWMATTAPATSATFRYSTEIELVILVTELLYIFLTPTIT